MFILNRSAIVIKLKQPYLDWANKLPDPDDISLDEMNRENNIYLIQEYDNDAHLEEIVESIHYQIFEEELDSWNKDRELWPDNRDYETFKQWFEVVPHSVVFDMLEEDIEGKEH